MNGFAYFDEGHIVRLPLLSGSEARHGHTVLVTCKKQVRLGKAGNVLLSQIAYLVRCQHQGGEAGLLNDVSNDERFPLYPEYEHAWGNREYMVVDVTARTTASHLHGDLQQNGGKFV